MGLPRVRWSSPQRKDKSEKTSAVSVAEKRALFWACNFCEENLRVILIYIYRERREAGRERERFFFIAHKPPILHLICKSNESIDRCRVQPITIVLKQSGVVVEVLQFLTTILSHSPVISPCKVVNVVLMAAKTVCTQSCVLITRWWWKNSGYLVDCCYCH